MRTGTPSQLRPSYRARIFEHYASGFQGFGPTFDSVAAQRWSRPYERYLRGWLPTDLDAPILDLACGSGRLLYFLKQSGYRNVSGIDVSPEQVQLARQVTANVMEGDILQFLASANQQYALITAFDIVEHFTKDEVLQFLDGCRRLLVPGGRLILKTPNAESPWGSVDRYNDFTHEVGFNPNSLSCLLRMCDYSDVEARESGPVPHGIVSAGRFVLWQTIRAGLMVWNLAETGSRGSGVYTRVFLMSATVPRSDGG